MIIICISYNSKRFVKKSAVVGLYQWSILYGSLHWRVWMECFISEQLLMVYVTWLSELGDIDHYTALKWYPGDMSCRNGLLDMDQLFARLWSVNPIRWTTADHIHITIHFQLLQTIAIVTVCKLQILEWKHFFERAVHCRALCGKKLVVTPVWCVRHAQPLETLSSYV